MATMYPMQVEESAQAGEKLVYAELKKLPEDWVVIHDCWQHYRTGRHYVNCEADFFVLVPGQGLITIEVKDWNVPVRIHEGEWQHLHGSTWVGMGRKRSPLNQAYLAGAETVKHLRRRNILPQKFEFQSLAVLLSHVPEELGEPVKEDWDIISSSGDPAVSSLYLCGIESLRDGLQSKLEKLFVHNNDTMTPALMKLIVDHLVPTQYFKLDIATYSAMMERAAAPIRQLLPMLEFSRGGIHVEGCAGSGKTVMACSEAVRLANRMQQEGSDGRILMLCFNRNLARELAQLPALAEHLHGEPPRLDISTLHAYCIDRYLRPQGQEGLLNFSGGEILTPAALACVSAQLRPTYDVVFVDEAQDFRHEWWEHIIHPLLRPGGRLFVFSDVNQNLFLGDSPLPDLPTRVRLSTNLRNVRQIAQLSAAILPEGTQLNTIDIDGVGVAIMPGSDDPQARAALASRAIEVIRREYGVPNRDIVILSPWRSNNRRCSLAFIPEAASPPTTAYEDVDAAAERHNSCKGHQAPRVLAETIRAYKGLEAPFIILTDIPSEEEGREAHFTRNDLYVACTRASVGLIMIPTAAAEKELRELDARCKIAPREA